MAGNQLAPAKFPSQERPESAPSSADFYLTRTLASGEESRKAPLDELTGLPLSIYYGPHHLGYSRNFQHGWHSKNKLSSILPESWAAALRVSRGYLIPLKYHMVESPYGYHGAVDEGPDPPTERDAVFEAIGLGVSNVLPRLSMDLTREPGIYYPKTLDNKQHRFVSKNTGFEKEFNPFPGVEELRRDIIGSFFAEHAIRSLFEDSSLTTVEEEVLFDPYQPLSRELGALMYRSSIDALNDLLPSVIEKYKTARTEGMVSGKTDPRTRILAFVPSHKFGKYFYEVRGWIAGEPLQTDVENVEQEAA